MCLHTSERARRKFLNLPEEKKICWELTWLSTRSYRGFFWDAKPPMSSAETSVCEPLFQRRKIIFYFFLCSCDFLLPSDKKFSAVWGGEAKILSKGVRRQKITSESFNGFFYSPFWKFSLTSPTKRSHLQHKQKISSTPFDFSRFFCASEKNSRSFIELLCRRVGRGKLVWAGMRSWWILCPIDAFQRKGN